MNKLNTYLRLCTEVYDLSKPKPPEASKLPRPLVGEAAAEQR